MTPHRGHQPEYVVLHLRALLTQAGKSWKSYQEDIDLERNEAGALINIPLSPDKWNVPLTSFSGVFGNSTINDFNQWQPVQLRRKT